MTRSHHYGVMAVAALLGTISMSGCLFAPIISESSSSTWQEPGLYDQLTRLEASPPAGFTIIRQGVDKSLPFPDASLDELDGAQPVQVVKDGTWCVCNWEGVVVGLAPGSYSREAAQMEQAAPDVQRAGFMDFARLVVVADDATLDRMADRFMASVAEEEWGGPSVKLTQPLTFVNVGAALDAAGAKPTSLERGANFAVLGHVQRTGGGFVVTYATPIRVLQGSHEGHPLFLEVAADDTARFHHREQSTGPGSVMNATQLQDALAAFMEALDRPAPTNVTFEHYHGD